MCRYLVEAADALLLVNALDAVEHALVREDPRLHPHAHGVEGVGQDVGQCCPKTRLNEGPVHGKES